jgi:beta-phosphoglucomutase-like phosphatase (HAD superfamily)
VIRAVIFDSDGTLLDSLTVIIEAYAHVASLYGYPAPTAEEVKAQLSQVAPLYQILKTFFPGPDANEMMRANGIYVAEHAMDVKTFPGLTAMLQELRALDLKLGIVTGGNDRVNDLLRHHGVDQYFASIRNSGRYSWPR